MNNVIDYTFGLRFKDSDEIQVCGKRQQLVHTGAHDVGFWCRNTKFFARKICNEVSRARVTHGENICDRQVKCGDKAFSKHFCELFGPNLCKDCSIRFMQTEALRDYRVLNINANNNLNDPFTVFVQWNATKGDLCCQSSDSEESMEIDSDSLSNDLTADNENFSAVKRPLMPLRRKKHSDVISSVAGRDADSGFESRCSTRLSQIRSLVRTNSNVSCRFKGLSRETTTMSERNQEKTKQISPVIREGLLLGEKQTSKLNNSVKSEKRPEVNNHLLSYHPKSLATLFTCGYPAKNKKDWIKLPVEPVLMDLKLINFTSYDKPLYSLADDVGLRNNYTRK